VCAPAYGHTADMLMVLCRERFGENYNIFQKLTKMANSSSSLETNEDIAMKIKELKEEPSTKIIFFSCALVDFQPEELVIIDSNGDESAYVEFGKHNQRLNSRDDEVTIHFKPSDKIISTIRQGRKDIFLVGFKTTCNASKQEMYEKGLRL